MTYPRAVASDHRRDPRRGRPTLDPYSSEDSNASEVPVASGRGLSGRRRGRSSHRRPPSALARDLPEAALRATSRRLMSPRSTVPLTWAVVRTRRVLHGSVNRPRIDGMQGSGVQIPSAPPQVNARAAATQHFVVRRRSGRPRRRPPAWPTSPSMTREGWRRPPARRRRGAAGHGGGAAPGGRGRPGRLHRGLGAPPQVGGRRRRPGAAGDAVAAPGAREGPVLWSGRRGDLLRATRWRPTAVRTGVCAARERPSKAKEGVLTHGDRRWRSCVPILNAGITGRVRSDRFVTL
jgi:hypothetical protein